MARGLLAAVADVTNDVYPLVFLFICLQPGLPEDCGRCSMGDVGFMMVRYRYTAGYTVPSVRS